MAGIDLPVTPERREIVVTEPVPGLDPRTPFTIDFASTFYFHAEGQGLLMGMSDPELIPEAVERRTPALSSVGIASGWAGLYEITPDHNALIGESDEISRFLYATGFSGHGFLMGPAVGEVVRDLYHGHRPVVDVSALDVRRFGPAAPGPSSTSSSDTEEPPMTLPNRDELTTLAEDVVARCGVELARGDRTATSPVNGEVLSSLAYADGRRRRGRPARARGVPGVAQGAGARPAALSSSGGASCSPSTRTTWPRWSASRSARSPPRPAARSRR